MTMTIETKADDKTTPVRFKTREQWLNAFVRASRPMFKKAGFPLPDNVRVSVGFTSSGARGKAIGECWSEASSADGHFEIFIKPTLEGAGRICDVLTHELVHAAVGLENGHNATFKRCAVALGLEGKMTATVAGKEWYEWALPIIDKLGALPHARLRAGKNSGKPKQKTNLLRVECDTCSWLARVTRTHLEPHGTLNCPTDCGGTLEWEG